MTRNARNGVTSGSYDVTQYVMPHVTPPTSETAVDGGGVTIRPSVTPQPPGITPVTPVTCQKTRLGFDVHVEPVGDVGPDFTVHLDDPAFSEQVAKERNANAALAGRTDRYCPCQKMATIAIGKRRATASNPEGVERWLCGECFEAGAPFPIPAPRRSSPGVANAPPGEPTIVDHGDTHVARTDWCEQPVSGWAEAKLTITPMVGDLTFEIDLAGGEEE